MTIAPEAPTLFDGLTVVPPIHTTFGEDVPRTRRTDPLTSHKAGDKSAETVSAVRRTVLELVKTRGTLTGSQANEMYRALAQYPANGLPLVHWDSPRKRLGELAAEKVLVVVNDGHPRGTETEYAFPVESAELAA